MWLFVRPSMVRRNVNRLWSRLVFFLLWRTKRSLFSPGVPAWHIKISLIKKRKWKRTHCAELFKVQLLTSAVFAFTIFISACLYTQNRVPGTDRVAAPETLYLRVHCVVTAKLLRQEMVLDMTATVGPLWASRQESRRLITAHWWPDTWMSLYRTQAWKHQH